MTESAKSALSARCRVEYPGFVLDASLELALEGVTVVFGPSGSGKTTLLRVIAGLERAARGRVSLGGDVWLDDATGAFVPPHLRRVGFVFQDARLFPHLSVESNLAYGLSRTPPGRRRFSLEMVVRLLDLDGLRDRRPASLSAGERQRVAIGRALLASPRLLLMDEPLASLDLGRKEEILSFVERLPATLGLPILYVSHSIDEVLRLAATLVLIDGGRIVATGPLSEVADEVDLRPFTGLFDEGAVVRAAVARHDPGDGLTYLAFAGGELAIPSLEAAVGTPVNALIRSRDVALSLEPPQGTSILNVLRGRVTEIRAEGGTQVQVVLDVGSPLRARIMRKSVGDLDLAAGKVVYALIKAVAVDQRTMGRPTAMDLSSREGSRGSGASS